MPVVPAKRIQKVEFYENHTTPWSTNAVAIGTTAGAVTALTTLTSDARDAFNAQQAAKNAAKAATLVFRDKVLAMADAGADIIKQIKAKAAVDGDGVYALAQIPAPAIPSPSAPPGTPSDFKVQLFQDGSLQLKWKCANPAGTQGTIYQVYRRTTPAGAFAFIGGIGSKKFIDTTLAAGSSMVTYQIVAVRSTASGAPAQFNVNFGVGGGGQMTASIATAETQPKLAA